MPIFEASGFGEFLVSPYLRDRFSNLSVARFLLFSLFFFNSVLALAQDGEFLSEDYSIYGKVGVVSAGTRGWRPGQGETGRVLGFHVGLGYAQAINSPETIWLSGEIGYSQHGYRYLDARAADDPQSVTTMYYNIPVLLRYYPFEKVRGLYVGAGPQLGIRTDGYMSTKGGHQYALERSEFPTTDFSAVGVLGIHVLRKAEVGAELKYQHGFTRVQRGYQGLAQSAVQVTVFFPGSIFMEALNLMFFL